MIRACPIDLDIATLRAEVQRMYSRVATAPDGEFHFHRGPAYAAEVLGYDATELATLPPDAWKQSLSRRSSPEDSAPWPSPVDSIALAERPRSGRRAAMESWA